MLVRFWGVRGSVPAPGPATVRYGGNTTCIEVCSPRGRRVILDAGTGIRPLGLELSGRMPLSCHIFLSHLHWDHIQGLPFFVPLFVPGNRVTLYGPGDPVNRCGVECVLERQLAYPFFPVRRAELQAEVEYRNLEEGRSVEIGDLRVTGVLMNHPAPNFGYRVDDLTSGSALFFTGDHEPFANIYASDEEEYAAYQEVVEARIKSLETLMAGVDLLIADGQYCEEEYEARRGWGHSTHVQAVDLARRIGARRVLLTHHETTRSDAELDAIREELRRGRAEDGPEADLAREGTVVELD